MLHIYVFPIELVHDNSYLEAAKHRILTQYPSGFRFIIYPFRREFLHPGVNLIMPY